MGEEKRKETRTLHSIRNRIRRLSSNTTPDDRCPRHHPRRRPPRHLLAALEGNERPHVTHNQSNDDERQHAMDRTRVPQTLDQRPPSLEDLKRSFTERVDPVLKYQPLLLSSGFGLVNRAIDEPVRSSTEGRRGRTGRLSQTEGGVLVGVLHAFDVELGRVVADVLAHRRLERAVELLLAGQGRALDDPCSRTGGSEGRQSDYWVGL